MNFLSRFVFVILFVAVFINNPDALMRAFLVVCGAIVALALVGFIVIIGVIMTLDILDRETP